MGEFLRHFCESFSRIFRKCCKRIWGMWQTHLGHVANAFGSCCKRIWVMWQTHLGHVANAFGVCGKRIWGPGGDTRQSRVIPDTASYSAWKCPQNKDTYSAAAVLTICPLLSDYFWGQKPIVKLSNCQVCPFPFVLAKIGPNRP